MSPQTGKRPAAGLLMMIFAFAILQVASALITSTPAQPLPSSNIYQDIPSSTARNYDGIFPGTSPLHTPAPSPGPAPGRYLKRQNNASFCNVGICSLGDYCTVFEIASVVTGSCCQNGVLCATHTTCINYLDHTKSDIAQRTMIAGTQFCGKAYPDCFSVSIQYGYGTSTLVEVFCASWPSTLTKVRETTTLNPLWTVYAKSSSTASSSLSDSLTSVTESSTPSFISLTASDSTASIPTTNSQTSQDVSISPSVGHQSLSAGSISGIAIGSIAAVAVSVVVILLVRHRLQKSAAAGHNYTNPSEQDTPQDQDGQNSQQPHSEGSQQLHPFISPEGQEGIGSPIISPVGSPIDPVMRINSPETAIELDAGFIGHELPEKVTYR